jgi:hypothetical protein
MNATNWVPTTPTPGGGEQGSSYLKTKTGLHTVFLWFISGVSIKGAECGVLGTGCTVYAAGCRNQGLGFTIWGVSPFPPLLFLTLP